MSRTLYGIVQQDVKQQVSRNLPILSDLHRNEMMDIIGLLRDCYRDVSDIYVSGHLPICYDASNPDAYVMPDVFIVKGVAKGERQTFYLWSEGYAPCAVIEITSRASLYEDSKTKYNRYVQLGIREYFLYEPNGEYLKPPLRGFRWGESGFEPMQASADGSLMSEELGLWLILEKGRLQFRNCVTWERLLRPSELPEAYRVAKQQIRHEIEARCAAEQHVRLAEAQARYEVEASQVLAERARAIEEQSYIQAELRQQEQEARLAAEEHASFMRKHAYIEAEARRATETQIRVARQRLAAAETELARMHQELAQLKGVPAEC